MSNNEPDYEDNLYFEPKKKMNLVKAGFEFIDAKTNEQYAKKIELCARNCYKSEGNITEDSCYRMVKNLIASGHTAMLEHDVLTVKLTTDVGAYKDLTRHRLAAYAIESTRWCNYTGDKFGNELTFTIPYHIDLDSEIGKVWLKHREEEQQHYFETLKTAEQYNVTKDGIPVSKTDIARMELSHSLKADVIITANFREWRHIFQIRCERHAHPSLRCLMQALLRECINRFPTFFEDLSYLLPEKCELTTEVIKGENC